MSVWANGFVAVFNLIMLSFVNSVQVQQHLAATDTEIAQLQQKLEILYNFSVAY